MNRDDISILYRYLGQSSHSYLDFHTEEDFRERINRVVARRALTKPAAAGSSSSAKSPKRKSKVVAVVSMGNLYASKLVASMAFLASKRLKGKVPVHIVDLIPVDDLHDERSILLSNGIKHVLMDASDQTVRMESSKEIDWLERQITADYDDGLVFVDVPERVMHMRHHVMAAADMLVVMVPANMTVVRAIEDVESELKEVFASGVGYGVFYLMVELAGEGGLAPMLKDELLSHKDMFLPSCLHRDAIPSARELSAGIEAVGYRSLVETCDFILGRLA